MRVTPLGMTEPLLDAVGNPRIEILKEAPGQKTDAQVTAGAMGHQNQVRPGGEAEMVQVGGGAGGWSKRFVRRGHVVKSTEYGVDEHGNIKLLTKRKDGKDEPGNSCHCKWVSPFN
jgi:hypothetical protein